MLRRDKVEKLRVEGGIEEDEEERGTERGTERKRETSESLIGFMEELIKSKY